MLGLLKRLGRNQADTGRLRRRRAALGLLALLLAVLALSVVRQVVAAIELAYYRGSSTNVSVLLEWATVREVNLDGFEILCKRASEPDTDYHAIGSKIAQGGPETGATYSFNVTSGIVYGEAYCFRLREVTTDGTPGERFDLCGYGPGVTPVPTVAAVEETGTVSPTAILVDNSAGVAGPTFTPTAAVVQGESPLLTATVVLTATPASTDASILTPIVTPAGQPESPLPAPQGGGSSADAAGSPAVAPVVTATPTLTPTATLPATPVQTETPTPTATQPDSPLSVVPAGEEMTTVEPTPSPTIGTAGGPAAATGEPIAEAPATATPIYVVVTATPTPETAPLVIQPTFTPWPTATAVPVFDLASLLVPSTQNMMVMLLCLIFLSASGLGVLGLITSVLYMRSQARRAGPPGPYYGRRRY